MSHWCQKQNTPCSGIFLPPVVEFLGSLAPVPVGVFLPLLVGVVAMLTQPLMIFDIPKKYAVTTVRDDMVNDS